MTPASDIPEIPRVARPISVTGRSAGTDSATAPPGFAGVIRPFSGILAHGIDTGDWPPPALAHLVLTPLLTIEEHHREEPSNHDPITLESTPAAPPERDESSNAETAELRVRELIRNEATKTEGESAPAIAPEETVFQSVDRRTRSISQLERHDATTTKVTPSDDPEPRTAISPITLQPVDRDESTPRPVMDDVPDRRPSGHSPPTIPRQPTPDSPDASDDEPVAAPEQDESATQREVPMQLARPDSSGEAPENTEASESPPQPVASAEPPRQDPPSLVYRALPSTPEEKPSRDESRTQETTKSDAIGPTQQPAINHDQTPPQLDEVVDVRRLADRLSREFDRRARIERERRGR